jgi:hypothetical protein
MLSNIPLETVNGRESGTWKAAAKQTAVFRYQ